MKLEKPIPNVREAEFDSYFWGDSVTLKLLLAATAGLWLLGVVYAVMRFAL
jgi:hypothetical protein